MGRGPEMTPQMRSRLCELRKIGWSALKIHKQHPEVPISTIKSTIRRESIRDDNKTLPRSGAPRKLSEEQRDHLYDLVQTNPQITLRELVEAVDGAVQKRSIQRLLTEMKLPRPKVPQAQNSKKP